MINIASSERVRDETEASQPYQASNVDKTRSNFSEIDTTAVGSLNVLVTSSAFPQGCHKFLYFLENFFHASAYKLAKVLFE